MDVDVDQFDCSIDGGELTTHDSGVHEPRMNVEVPVVTPPRVRHRQLVPQGSEGLHDVEQVGRRELRGGRLPARAPLGGQLRGQWATPREPPALSVPMATVKGEGFRVVNEDPMTKRKILQQRTKT
jgi:hypothetical protein